MLTGQILTARVSTSSTQGWNTDGSGYRGCRGYLGGSNKCPMRSKERTERANLRRGRELGCQPRLPVRQPPLQDGLEVILLGLGEHYVHI